MVISGAFKSTVWQQTQRIRMEGHACLCMTTYTRKYLDTHMLKSFMHMRVYMYICIQIYTHTYMYIHIHIRVHIHIYVYIQVYIYKASKNQPWRERSSSRKTLASRHGDKGKGSGEATLRNKSTKQKPYTISQRVQVLLYDILWS